MPAKPLPQIRPSQQAHYDSDYNKLSNKPSINVKSYFPKPELLPQYAFRESDSLLINHGKSDSVDSSDGLRRSRDEFDSQLNIPPQNANENHNYDGQRNINTITHKQKMEVSDHPPAPPPRAYKLVHNQDASGAPLIVPSQPPAMGMSSAQLLEKMRLEALDNRPPPVPPHGSASLRGRPSQPSPVAGARSGGRVVSQSRINSTPGSRYGSAMSINQANDAGISDYRVKLSSVRATLGDDAAPLGDSRRPGSVSQLSYRGREGGPLERTGSIMSMRDERSGSPLNRSASSAAKNAMLKERLMGGRKISSPAGSLRRATPSPSPSMRRSDRGKSEEIGRRSVTDRNSRLYNNDNSSGIYAKPNVPNLKSRTNSYDDLNSKQDISSNVSPSKVSQLVRNYNSAVETQQYHYTQQSVRSRKGSASSVVTGLTEKELENIAEREAEAKELFGNHRRSKPVSNVASFDEVRSPRTPPPSACSSSFEPVTNIDSYEHPMNPYLPTSRTSSRAVVNNEVKYPHHQYQPSSSSFPSPGHPSEVNRNHDSILPNKLLNKPKSPDDLVRKSSHMSSRDRKPPDNNVNSTRKSVRKNHQGRNKDGGFDTTDAPRSHNIDTLNDPRCYIENNPTHQSHDRLTAGTQVSYSGNFRVTDENRKSLITEDLSYPDNNKFLANGNRYLGNEANSSNNNGAAKMGDTEFTLPDPDNDNLDSGLGSGSTASLTPCGSGGGTGEERHAVPREEPLPTVGDVQQTEENYNDASKTCKF